MLGRDIQFKILIYTIKNKSRLYVNLVLGTRQLKYNNIRSKLFIVFRNYSKSQVQIIYSVRNYSE